MALLTMNIVTKQLYGTTKIPDINFKLINISLMSMPEVTGERKLSEME